MLLLDNHYCKLLRTVGPLKTSATILVKLNICGIQGDSCADGSLNADEQQYGLLALAGTGGGGGDKPEIGPRDFE
jgi:hypothetical protein